MGERVVVRVSQPSTLRDDPINIAGSEFGADGEKTPVDVIDGPKESTPVYDSEIEA